MESDDSTDTGISRTQVGLLAVCAFFLTASTTGYGRYTFFTSRAAALLLAGAVSVTLLRTIINNRDRVTTAVCGFVGAVAVATATSDNTYLAFWGSMNLGPGLVAWALLGLCLLAAANSGRHHRLITAAIGGGIALNVGLAWIQGWVDLPHPYGIVLSRAHGLSGNPVFLGPLAAAGIVLAGSLLTSKSRAARWLGIVGVALSSGAVQLSGSRVALVAAVAGLVWVLLTARERIGALLLTAAATVAAFVFASTAPMISAQTAAERIGDSAGGIRDRLHIWEVGLRGWLDRPFTGWGPGRFQAGTSMYRTPEMIEYDPNIAYDGHNHFVEILTTTGLVGMTSFVILVAVLARRARGPAGVAAGLMFLCGMMQPLSASVTPVMVVLAGVGLAHRLNGPPTAEPLGEKTTVGVHGPDELDLGAEPSDERILPGTDEVGSRGTGSATASKGAAGRRPKSLVATVGTVAACLALVWAAVVVVAVDALQHRSFLTGDNEPAMLALRLGPDWPDLYDQVILNTSFAALQGDKAAGAAAVEVAETRAALDRADFDNHIQAGNLHMQWGDHDRALELYEIAHAQYPLFPPVLHSIIMWDLHHGQPPFPVAQEACRQAELHEDISCSEELDEIIRNRTARGSGGDESPEMTADSGAGTGP